MSKPTNKQTQTQTQTDAAAALRAELEALRAENAALKAQPKAVGSIKLGDKGTVNVYGLGRFPVSLYASQWRGLLAMANEIEAFLQRPDVVAATEAALVRKQAAKGSTGAVQAQRPVSAYTTAKDKFGRTVTVVAQPSLPAAQAVVDAHPGFPGTDEGSF